MQSWLASVSWPTSSVPRYLACSSVLAYLCVLDCLTVLAYLCVLDCLSVLAYLCVLDCLSVLAYFSNLACLRCLAYFCVLAYFSYLACLTQFQIVNDNKFFDNVFKYLRLSTISHKKSLTDKLNLNYLGYKTWASINDWPKRFHLLIHFLSTLSVEKCFVLPTTIHFTPVSLEMQVSLDKVSLLY